MTFTCPTCGSAINPIDILVSLNDNTIATSAGSVKVMPRLAELAFHLAELSPQFVPTDRIRVALWGSDYGIDPGEWTLRKHVDRLRSAVKAIGVKVENKHGCGYRMMLNQPREMVA